MYLRGVIFLELELLIKLIKSKTIKSKVNKFQHQKHYVFYDFFQLMCII